MNKKNSSKKYILAIAVAFLLPLSLYLIVRALSIDKIFLPKYYRVDRVEERTEDGKTVKDTIYHQVADSRFTNQLGEHISLNQDLAGKILVVNFFFVNCPSICPKLTGNMTILQKAFKKTDSVVHLLSFTVNPERDTPSVLRAYADRFKVNHDHWWFLTGDKENIYNFARNELGVSVQPSEGGADDFVHTEKIVLIDQQRYIRGYYNGLDTADLKRCADDIVLLTLEKKKKRK